MCYMFPRIHLWCNTFQPLGGQHGSQVVLFHIPASRHWWGYTGPLAVWGISGHIGWVHNHCPYRDVKCHTGIQECNNNVSIGI